MNDGYILSLERELMSSADRYIAWHDKVGNYHIQVMKSNGKIPYGIHDVVSKHELEDSQDNANLIYMYHLQRILEKLKHFESENF